MVADRDQLNVSRNVKGNRRAELGRVVRYNRGRNYLSPWRSGRRRPATAPATKRRLNKNMRSYKMPGTKGTTKTSAYDLGYALGMGGVKASAKRDMPSFTKQDRPKKTKEG